MRTRRGGQATPPNPWQQGLTGERFNIAHQGGAREGPSNTMWAIRHAVEVAGAQVIEGDVHPTAGDELVLCHDDTLNRTTNGDGKVSKHTLAQLRTLDAAYWWMPGKVDDHEAPSQFHPLRAAEGSPQVEELRIPTLKDVLERFSQPVIIEVKVKEAVLPLVRVLHELKVPAERIIVVAFDHAIVRKLREEDPQLPLAAPLLFAAWFFLCSRVGLRCSNGGFLALQVSHRFAWADFLTGTKRVVARFLAGLLLPERWRSFTVVDQRFVAAAHHAGMAVHVWTVDEAEEMEALIDLGVDGIMTDCPTTLATVVANRADRTTRG
ncbi:MAG TPA: glycerophosphodiester phosphodiesterase family protein [Acidimicrobiia bacterium]|jgi:glycerophosphoryl diester phosphodiesterase